MQLTLKKIDDLHLFEENTRTHNNKNIKLLMESLKSFGQQKPIVIDLNNQVICGNGTLQAAKKLGWSDIWCHVSALSDTLNKAYSAVDNHRFSFWDHEALDLTIEQIEEDGFEMTPFMFNEPDEKRKLKEIECPECHHKFTI
jgi:ParB-like chromosome segregation protein Spo0J